MSGVRPVDVVAFETKATGTVRVFCAAAGVFADSNRQIRGPAGDDRRNSSFRN